MCQNTISRARRRLYTSGIKKNTIEETVFHLIISHKSDLMRYDTVLKAHEAKRGQFPILDCQLCQIGKDFSQIFLAQELVWNGLKIGWKRFDANIYLKT